MTCPSCQSPTRQVKHGRNPWGSQRYLCQSGTRTYTPAPTAFGYDADTRQHALRLYADGMNLRRSARHLGVVHQTVATWVAAHADALPDQPPQPPTPVQTAARDELYTSVGRKKNVCYVVTAVERATRCSVSYAVVWERPWEALHETVDRAAPARQYDSDAVPPYETLVYDPGRHAVAPGKSQTDSVAADNAALRHDLARLGRRSRCFSRSIAALRRALKLFVPAWNRRHLHQRA